MSTEREDKLEQVVLGTVIGAIAVMFAGCVAYGFYAHKHVTTFRTRSLRSQFPLSFVLLSAAASLAILKCMWPELSKMRVIYTLRVRHVLGAIILNCILVGVAHLVAPFWTKFLKTSEDNSLRNELY